MEEHKPVYLGLIIEEAVKLLRASLPSTIEIRTQLDTASGMVQANAGHMQQLLMNLCTNAAQAMSENGGVIEITMTPVYLDEQHAATLP